LRNPVSEGSTNERKESKKERQKRIEESKKYTREGPERKKTLAYTVPLVNGKFKMCVGVGGLCFCPCQAQPGVVPQR
jgi:hypothetical protein